MFSDWAYHCFQVSFLKMGDTGGRPLHTCKVWLIPWAISKDTSRLKSTVSSKPLGASCTLHPLKNPWVLLSGVWGIWFPWQHTILHLSCMCTTLRISSDLVQCPPNSWDTDQCLHRVRNNLKCKMKLPNAEIQGNPVWHLLLNGLDYSRCSTHYQWLLSGKLIHLQNVSSSLRHP